MNVVDLPKKDDLQASVEAIKRSLPAFIEMQGLLAQIRRASYDAHIKQGFTPEQALFLCTNTRV